VVGLAHLLGWEAGYEVVRHPKQLTFEVVARPPAPALTAFLRPPAAPERRCDRRAAMRGMFLGCGSVNAPSARYHLELVAPDQAWADVLALLLRSESIRAGLTERSGHPLCYVKDGDGVARVLSLVGASRAVMAFENARVVRELNAQVNRQLNFETANLDKTATSNTRQLAAIKHLEERGGLDRLPPALREIAQLRLRQPELNLTEIARLLDLSKSGINHRLRRLLDAAATVEPED
jgi:hypothetical protein